MENILIYGGNKLYGNIKISGMKNSALPILYATILVSGESIIHNVPRVSDIFNSLEILKGLGAKAEFCDTNTLRINTNCINSRTTTPYLISKMRASYYLLGTLLSRFGEAQIPIPGGCNFGVRPIEQHLKGFEALGAKCIEDKEKISVIALNKLKNNKITLDKISVGATINMVLASVLVKGVTIIKNSAIEPHVDDLINFLNRCGAKIIRYGRRIYIIGVEALHGVEYSIYPDMIESLTYMCFLGVCQGEIVLDNINLKHLTYELDIFKEMGYVLIPNGNSLIVKVDKMLSGSSIETNPYPLFPTDLQPQFSSLLCYTKNGGEVIENIYPSRFAYVNELQKMGARITKSSNKIVVQPSRLTGAKVEATDLRAGAALITAALGANGQSEIKNVKYIVRGYESITEKISSIGGKIKLI